MLYIFFKDKTKYDRVLSKVIPPLLNETVYVETKDLSEKVTGNVKSVMWMASIFQFVFSGLLT